MPRRQTVRQGTGTQAGRQAQARRRRGRGGTPTARSLRPSGTDAALRAGRLLGGCGERAEGLVGRQKARGERTVPRRAGHEGGGGGGQGLGGRGASAGGEEEGRAWGR